MRSPGSAAAPAAVLGSAAAAAAAAAALSDVEGLSHGARAVGSDPGRGRLVELGGSSTGERKRGKWIVTTILVTYAMLCRYTSYYGCLLAMTFTNHGMIIEVHHFIPTMVDGLPHCSEDKGSE